MEDRRMPSAVLRKRFMDAAVADVLRAADGGSVVGSAILAICVLDYLAYLRTTDRNEGRDFKELVTDYLIPIDGRYRPDEIWAWRCSLIHTYAAADAMSGAHLDGYQMTHRRPEFHLYPLSRTLAINVDTFVAEVIWGANKFFAATSGNSNVEERGARLVVVRSEIEILTGYGSHSDASMMAKPYATMHPALRELDAATPQIEKLRADVTARYPENPVTPTMESPVTSGSGPYPL
jgi:hypothetical protein